MDHRTFRHTVIVGALTLMAAAPLAACAGDPLAPLPPQAASSAPATTASTPATSASLGSAPPRVTTPVAGNPVRTTTTKTTRPTTKPTSTCYGAVRKDVEVQDTELAVVKSMCFHVGGVLRLKGIGPGLVTATPTSKASQHYEAGVVDVQFVRAGTVTVTIPLDEETYTITVVVVS